ncbi:hypothetical protein M231_03790 [Tremella mesenterica]|uniref:Uncharacterized protein n=1 Tax=Tremella mesenterica TaxID=5217 RepID=A0A4Q1BMA2_TREME|nr:hypothetical protein M231_03790 [Tremella mesenterica]
MSIPSAPTLLPQDAFSAQFERDFITWLGEKKFTYTFTDEDIQARRYVLTHDGVPPPNFQPPHNSWLTKVRKQHRLSDNGEEVLYRPSPDSTQWYKLVAMSQVLAVIKRVHCLQTTHAEQNKTHEEIARYYKGVGKKEVVKAIKSCNIRMLKARNKDPGEIHPITSQLPFECGKQDYALDLSHKGSFYKVLPNVEEIRLDGAEFQEEEEEEESQGALNRFQWETDSDKEEEEPGGQEPETESPAENSRLQLPATSSTNPIQQLIDEESNARRNPTASDRLIAKMQEQQAVRRAKLVEQHGRFHKHWVYKTDDKVTLFVPAKDRPGAPASRIPCVQLTGSLISKR